jgi:hypothetical protein
MYYVNVINEQAIIVIVFNNVLMFIVNLIIIQLDRDQEFNDIKNQKIKRLINE